MGLIGRAIHRTEWWTLPCLALLLVVLGALAVKLSDNVRGLDTWLLLTLSAVGLLTGWGLGALSLAGWLAGILASALGTGVVLLRIGRLDRKGGGPREWSLTCDSIGAKEAERIGLINYE